MKKGLGLSGITLFIAVLFVASPSVVHAATPASSVSTEKQDQVNKDSQLGKAKSDQASPSPKVKRNLPQATEKLEKLMNELHEREFRNQTLILEGERKSIDWILTLLTILIAVIALLGGAVPYLFGRKQREDAERDKIEIKRLLDSAEDAVSQINEHKNTAAKEVELIKNYTSGADEEKSDEIKQAVNVVSSSPSVDANSLLRAKAIAASQNNSAERAYLLWNALAELNSNDARASFNAGYWADELASSDPDGAHKLWKNARGMYRQALNLKPDFHEAANNWGNGLASEAKALAASDLNGARELWKKAGEKFQQALSIKPDYHKATNNWGSALFAEAKALAASDEKQAGGLYQRAEKLLLSLSECAQDIVAYNLACLYAQQGNVNECLKWLKVSQKYQNLPDCDHIKSDSDLDPIRSDPAFIAWLNDICSKQG